MCYLCIYNIRNMEYNDCKSEYFDPGGALVLDRVKEMKTIRIRMREQKRRMEVLAQPPVADMSRLHDVYDVYLRVLDRRNKGGYRHDIYERKKFLMAALYLFSPASLAGGKMLVGLRSRLAEILGVRNHATISENASGVMVLYHGYRDFRRDVDAIIAESMVLI